MCGIFGVCFNQESGLTPEETKNILNNLFCLSQSRGQEASGLLMKSGEYSSIYKDTIKGNKFIKRAEYKQLFKNISNQQNENTMMIGHARLDTNGSKWDNTNNSPINYDGISGIHNGIVANVEQLWLDNSELKRHYTVDSEVLLAIFSKKINEGMSEQEALQYIFQVIEGSASVAIFSEKKDKLSLGTNTGSLYFTCYSDDLFIFASEQYILEQLHKKLKFLHRYTSGEMRQISPKTSLTLDLKTLQHTPYEGRLVHAIL